MTQPSAAPSQAPSETLTTPATSVAGAAVVTPNADIALNVEKTPNAHVTQPSPTLNWSTSSASTPGLSDTLHVAGGLAIVIAFIFVLGLLVKRLSSGSLRRSGKRVLKTIDTQAVGNKERIAVMEVNDTWLVVGISPQGISTLHTMPRPDDQPARVTATADTPYRGMPFSQALRKAARQTFGRTGARSQTFTDRDSHKDRNDHA